MDKFLRVITGNIIVSSTLSKEAKLQLLNFVKEEASDSQIKALLLDGKIVHLDEQAKEIVNERFARYEKFYENKCELLKIKLQESQNLEDSILFLLSARTALINIVESDRESTSAQKGEMVDFLVNEASDYQIMHLLLCNDLPENKYDPVAEEMLYRDFKESILNNKNFVTELIGEENLTNILYEVDSISHVTSTQLPILEFGRQNDSDIDDACLVFSEELFSAYDHYLTEKPRWKGDVAGHLKGAWDKNKGLRTDVKSGAKTAAKGAVVMGKDVIDRTSKGIKALKHKNVFKTMGSRGGSGLPDKYISSIGADKAAAIKAGSTGARVVKAVKAAAGTAATAAKGAAAKGAAAAGTAATAAKGAAAKGAAYAGTAATAAKGAAAKGAAAVGQAAATPAGMAVGGAAAAALAIYAGYKIYKRFFSQAAKACAGKSTAEKTACMKNFRKQAIMKQIAATQGGMGKCAKSKNPEACRRAIQNKISSLKVKMSKK